MDPQNNAGGAPLLDPPAENQPALNAMTQLAQAMATLANISMMQLVNNLSKTKAVQKPSPFKGDQGSDTQRFLAAFTMWVMAQGMALNTVDQHGEAVDHCDM